MEEKAMRALRESASRGERHQARHMRQETGQHDKAGDAPRKETEKDKL